MLFESLGQFCRINYKDTATKRAVYYEKQKESFKN